LRLPLDVKFVNVPVLHFHLRLRMALSTEQLMLVEQRIANDKKSTVVAYLLWFFFGGLGVHRFYLGKSGSGAAMLALTILGFLTAVIYIGVALLLVVAIWLIVDAFLIPGLIAQSTQELRQRLQLEIGVGSSTPPAIPTH
jgi:TM2 domain-containing membrane protein YozV